MMDGFSTEQIVKCVSVIVRLLLYLENNCGAIFIIAFNSWGVIIIKK